MNKFSKIQSLIRNPYKLIEKIIIRFPNIFPDKLYLQLLYRSKIGHWINWKKPKTFTEKIQWLKIYNRQQEYTMMVDKYEAKKYVANIIGEKHIIQTIGVWDDPEDIIWDSLPDKFVLKTTHGGGGGGVIICKDKKTFDKRTAIEKLRKSLEKDIFTEFREWPYKNVHKRIIAEKFIETNTENLFDYKFFCFNGKVKFFKVDFDRFVDHHANYYSPEGILLKFGEADFPPIPTKVIKLPENLDEMIILSEKLSRNTKFLRVDLYNVKSKIYFGELTFFPASGMGKWTPEEYDRIIGDYLNISNK